MAYTVREVSDMAAFEQLVAFQEHSADEVNHRRERAGFTVEPHTRSLPDANRRHGRIPPRIS